MAYTELLINADGGCQFSAHLIADDDDLNKFLGTVEVGNLDDDGQWEGDEDEVVKEVFEAFGDAIPAEIKIHKVF